MGAIAQIKDGKVVESNSAASLAKDTKKNGSTMDKEAFLNLLVAQMKYQDPLEPTSAGVVQSIYIGWPDSQRKYD